MTKNDVVFAVIYSNRSSFFTFLLNLQTNRKFASIYLRMR